MRCLPSRASRSQGALWPYFYWGLPFLHDRHPTQYSAPLRACRLPPARRDGGGELEARRRLVGRCATGAALVTSIMTPRTRSWLEDKTRAGDFYPSDVCRTPG